MEVPVIFQKEILAKLKNKQLSTRKLIAGFKQALPNVILNVFLLSIHAAPIFFYRNKLYFPIFRTENDRLSHQLHH